MKKIYTIVAIMFLFAGAYAQTSDSKQGTIKQLNQVTKPSPARNHVGLEKSLLAPFWEDLDSADNFIVQNQQGTYNRFTWLSNMHYVQADTSASAGNLQKEFYVVFDTLIDSYNMNGPTGYSYANNTSFTIDSIELWCGNVNYSGDTDTLVIQIVKLLDLSQGIYYFPDSITSGVLWTDTILIPPGTPLGNFSSTSNGGVIAAAPNFAVSNANNDTRFAVKGQYFGDLQDTFWFVAGVPTFAGGGNCNGYAMADSSNYHPSSYHDDVQFGQIFPTTGDGFVWYPCSSSTSFVYGTDGYDYIQDIEFWVQLGNVNSAGIQEDKALGIKLFQNVPNPTNGTSVISYELAKGGTATLNITDIAGRSIKSFDQGMQGAGTYNVTVDSKEFAQGIYFYTLNVDGVTLTNKMIVTK
jgi:hypothetical protein